MVKNLKVRETVDGKSTSLEDVAARAGTPALQCGTGVPARPSLEFGHFPMTAERSSSRFLSGSIARKSHERFGSWDFRANRNKTIAGQKSPMFEDHDENDF